ncbi:MAG: hypothetical protein MKZ95_05115 [Pirellulales bacterium]|nr:hypothetical protein [Pirellulales bacterium]
MAQFSATDVYASAESHFLAGKLEQARDELEAALQLDSNAGQLWELLGMVSYTQGDSSQTVDALEQASLLVPLANCSQYVLAVCYEKREQIDPAHAIYRHLASLNELDDNLLEPVTRALGRCDDCEGALRVCRLAARRNPDCPEPLIGMVFYMRRLNRSSEQILPLLFRAFHLNPEDNDCRLILARTLHECGRSDEAAYLLSYLAIEEFRCPNCLSAMEAIFNAAGDEENLARCHVALKAIKEDLL